MKMPLNWAKDFAEFTCTPHEYAERMTMSGSKVETYTCEADAIKNVVVGKILEIVPHPDSDHMVVCQVEVAPETVVQIVTGADNLKVGDLAPTALHGAKLPDGKEIRKGKLRGVESNGMLCSLGELGLTKHDFPNATEDGILVIEETFPVGTNAAVALGMDDVSVEFEITPNRPDCLSVRGLARESAATFAVPFIDHVPQTPAGSGDISTLLHVTVEDKELCSRYTAAMVENVRIKPSPRWMRERLRLCGVRPINNIVDITNYVMLEYGQPMHAFDYAYVNGKIRVRRAAENEKIVTLDGIERTLTQDILVIADEKCPIGIAGVMGGEFSGIYDNTQRIVFESACFDGPSVRLAAKKVGLRTEASARFEKGLNPASCLAALQRALELVVELDAGDVIGGIVDDYPAPRLPRRVKLRPDTINKLLGTNLSREAMIAYLLPLGFAMDGDDVIVPPERYDVERDCDLAEEVARYVGYNKMPSTAVRGVASARPSERQRFHGKMIDALIGYGLYEIETFSFFSRKAFDAVNLPADDALRHAVVISNPLGEDTSIMRTTALPSMMDVIARNYNARAAECALFEDATVYTPLGESADILPLETEKIVLAAFGAHYDYLTLKGIVEKLLETAGVTDARFVRNTAGTSYHPGRCADIYIGDELLGTIGEVHPAVLSNYGVKPRVVAGEVNLDVLYAHRAGTTAFKPLPKHPAITRDLALVADADIPAADIAARITAAAGKALESLTLFDIYTGDKIAADKKSLAYNLVLRGSDRTLTDEEAENAVKKVLKSLAEISVVLRS
ncbi:MAG: phenylalanine--tRNA ligase subunit beta [Ruthenibacterium sp.]